MTNEDLVSLIPIEYQTRVREGELEVLVGQNPAKPVVRVLLPEVDINGKLYQQGQLVPGSGRYPRAIDAAKMGKATAYKHSNSYRGKLEELWPMDGDENTRGSLAWLAKMTREAADGSPQMLYCPECGAKSLQAFKKDGLLLFKLTELLTGKARETQDLNIKSESLIAILNSREPITEITVHQIDPRIAAERRIIIDQDE